MPVGQSPPERVIVPPGLTFAAPAESVAEASVTVNGVVSTVSGSLPSSTWIEVMAGSETAKSTLNVPSAVLFT